MRICNHFDVDPLKTSHNFSIHLKKNKQNRIAQLVYAKIIGTVMFSMNYTRPNSAYVVHRLSRYTHKLSKEHLNALTHLLRYLKEYYGLGFTLW